MQRQLFETYLNHFNARDYERVPGSGPLNMIDMAPETARICKEKPEGR